MKKSIAVTLFSLFALNSLAFAQTNPNPLASLKFSTPPTATSSAPKYVTATSTKSQKPKAAKPASKPKVTKPTVTVKTPATKSEIVKPTAKPKSTKPTTASSAKPKTSTTTKAL